MKKNLLFFFSVLGVCLIADTKAFSMNCHSGGEEGSSHGKQEEDSYSKRDKKERTGKTMNMKESIYSTVYTCPMHPDVEMDKPGNCPECGMKLEKKQIKVTYACPENDCEYQKAKPGSCPHHDKELIKSEIKEFCPKCGAQVDAEKLITKPVKINRDMIRSDK